MCIAVEKEQVVAGFVNTHEDGLVFTTEDIYTYTRSLFNAGCGIVRLNYFRWEMEDFLNHCRGICLSNELLLDRWKIDKSFLSDYMTPEEHKFLHGDKELAKKFHLFCMLRVDVKTPDLLLDAMGFRFMYAE